MQGRVTTILQRPSQPVSQSGHCLGVAKAPHSTKRVSPYWSSQTIGAIGTGTLITMLQEIYSCRSVLCPEHTTTSWRSFGHLRIEFFPWRERETPSEVQTICSIVYIWFEYFTIWCEKLNWHQLIYYSPCGLNDTIPRKSVKGFEFY